MNDYEAHLSSYDHSHKQRLKDMKQMVRDPQAAARARRQEQKNEGVISIKLGEAAAGGAGAAGGGGGGFKKGGFKKSGFKSAFVLVGENKSATSATAAPAPGTSSDTAPDGQPGIKRALRSELVESDTEDEGYEVYDPRKPTD